MDNGIPSERPRTQCDLQGDREPPRPVLDRSQWHQPLVAVVIAHFNYSDYLEDAIVSVIDQSYQRVECIVVDDGSSPSHRQTARQIASQFQYYGVHYRQMDRNQGQIPAFFAGLDETSAEFVCLLDPDDRYAKTFIESSIDAHLNNDIYCPMTTTDQYKFRENELINATHAHYAVTPPARPSGLEIKLADYRAHYFDSSHVGGFFTSTSCLMFRRGVVELLRPIKSIPYRGEADSYLANGAHMLGGTIFIEKPLVYRQLHGKNAWMTENYFSMDQIRYRPGAEQNSEVCKRDSAAAFLENGARDLFERRYLSKLLYRHFSRDSLKSLRKESHHAAELAPPGFTEWRRRRRYSRA
jgi:glycosyltransferase involved in cell wall biosynthesis